MTLAMGCQVFFHFFFSLGSLSSLEASELPSVAGLLYTKLLPSFYRCICLLEFFGDDKR